MPSDLERVERWFADGDLLHPFHADAPPSTVDLARAVAKIGGVPLNDADGSDERAAALADRIGGEKPLLFVLVDGLGCAFCGRTRPDGFLATAEHVQLRAVFPSTTAAALTAVATGAWPAQHGVPAWDTHFHSHNLTATILPFIERRSKRPLQQCGIQPHEAFSHPSRLAAIPHRLRTYHPEQIAESEFTSYGRGQWPTDGYRNLSDAVEQVSRRLLTEREGGVHYLYLPMLDAAAHRAGPDGRDTQRALEAVDDALTTLRERLDGRARIAVSPDHGELQIPERGKATIPPDDPLLDFLHVEPAGEARVPMFCVESGQEAVFEDQFRSRFGKTWALLNRQAFQQLELFGRGTLSSQAAERIGTHLALTPQPNILTYGERGNPQSKLKGHHAGLRPEEMKIPLLLA